ncbi:GNAT family N-acetyltransferase [Rhodopseudomonas sp. HC1]|uniref:GNAT family N-acetyltransferase n=1 Tax=Rhodopseudomonas infernalis TaxID=2897386 RepID=UPI001EE7DBA7|nr:GNAT family N-acetyltransferase [Rhodopseudomonas infernalis]MCG6207035.1 GNAT family N-acetyltransferase [Rhodopseudomonas infernalis]
MIDTVAQRGEIRVLGPADTDRYCNHLSRLDPEARRMRFFADVSDFHVLFHAGVALSDGRVVIGYVEDDEIRGACELLASGEDPHGAEAAFSVEHDWRRAGIGGVLMTAMIDAARQRGVQRIELQCLKTNVPMQALAARFTSDLRQIGDTTLAVLDNSAAAAG